MNVNDSLFDPIGEKVLIIRGQYIMLDRDLAGLYGVDTKRLNEAVKRNISRFDEDFMFQLTETEKLEVVANCDHLQMLRFSHQFPYAFTELGISMISSVLNSEIAIRVNKQIMRYFVHMRNLELTGKDFRKYVETKFKLLDERLKNTNNKLDTHVEVMKDILEQIRRMIKPPDKPRKQIGFRKE